MRISDFEVRCPGCGEEPVYRMRFGVRACSCWVEEELAEQRAAAADVEERDDAGE
jgi:hypothetical protein